MGEWFPNSTPSTVSWRQWFPLTLPGASKSERSSHTQTGSNLRSDIVTIMILKLAKRRSNFYRFWDDKTCAFLHRHSKFLVWPNQKFLRIPRFFVHRTLRYFRKSHKHFSSHWRSRIRTHRSDNAAIEGSPVPIGQRFLRGRVLFLEQNIHNLDPEGELVKSICLRVRPPAKSRGPKKYFSC